MSDQDLLQDYFKRDLGPGEDEALAQDLAASPEQTGRFAQLAAEDYSNLGLPEPVWPEKPSRRRAWLLVLLAGTLTGLGVWQTQTRVEKPAVLIAPEAGRPAMEAPLAPEAVAETPVHPGTPAPASTQRLRVQASPQGFLVSLEPGPGFGPLSVQDAQGRALCQVPVDVNGRWLWRGVDSQGRAVAPGSYRLVAGSQGRNLSGWVEVGRRRKP